MKRAFVCFVLILMSLNVFAEKLKISQDANMRAAPNKDSEVVKVLKSGTTCEGELSKENSNWYEIKVDESVGYVHKSLVKAPFNYSAFAKEHPYLVGIVFLIILVLIIKKGVRTKCPKCKRWFAEKKLKKEFLDSDGHYETKTRTDIRRNSRGEQIGTTERQEQVHMTTNYYRQHCKCKYCGYQYYYNISNTFEG